MLKLLTCPQGHYWEKQIEDGADGQHDVCPQCGQAAETMPLLDLEPSEVQPAAPAEPPPPPPLRDKDGRPVVAGYEILQDLGKGPTGVRLYRARQLLVNRVVVLKVVFAREDPGQFAWGSLRGEAAALGRLAHPNILQILEAGERDRQLFYNAVEHVEGPTLADVLGEGPVPIRQALALVETLARTVHHAHEKNVLHRNLKPASVLLQTRNAEGKRQNALSFCIPKITDFGLARRPVEGDAADVELQGKLPCYLSPEQAWGRSREIGPATDVYGLGAILYELLTGRPPFRGDTVAQTLDAVQYKEPVPPSRRRSGVSADLDAICRKCLAKQPRRRYASALELADDLRRCAGGYPVKARTIGGVARLRKWVRRNLRAVALVLLGLWAVISVLALGSSGGPASPGGWREREHRAELSRMADELIRTRKSEEAANYLRYLLLAERAIQSGDRERGREELDRCPQAERHWEWHYLRSLPRDGKGDRVFASEAPVTSVAFSPDGRYLAVGSGDSPDQPGNRKSAIALDDLTRQGRQRRWDCELPVRGVAFSKDGGRLAIVGCGARPDGVSEVQVRDVLTGQILFAKRYPTCQLTALAFSRDQRALIVAGGGDPTVRVLHAQSGDLLLTQSVAFRQQVWPPVAGTHARLVPLRPDGERIALISPDGTEVAILDDLRPGVPITSPAKLMDHQRKVQALAYDERGETLAVAGSDKEIRREWNATIRLWNARFPQRPPAVLSTQGPDFSGVTFSSDGKRLASCDRTGTVRIWDAGQRQEVLALRGYAGATGVVFGADGNSPAIDRLAIVHGNKVTVLAPQGFEAAARGTIRFGVR